MAGNADRILSWTVAAAAILIAAAVVKREFFGQAPPGSPTTTVLTYHANWRGIAGHGIAVGAAAAPITIVEFFDLECPACSTFHRFSLDSIRAEYGDSVNMRFVHWPLARHRFARPAARAAECANDQRRFTQFLDVIYEKQDSLGLKSWSDYASEARVSDVASFEACLSGTRPYPRIDSGVVIAERLQLPGTPTVIVNGWRFSRTPSASQLTRVIEDLLAGKEPELAP